MTWHITKDERGKPIGAPLQTDIVRVEESPFEARVFINEVQTVLDGKVGKMRLILVTNEWFHNPLRLLVASRIGKLVSDHPGHGCSFHGEGEPTKRWDIIIEFHQCPGDDFTEVAAHLFVDALDVLGVKMNWEKAPPPKVVQETLVEQYIAADHETVLDWEPYGTYLAKRVYPKK